MPGETITHADGPEVTEEGAVEPVAIHTAEKLPKQPIPNAITHPNATFAERQKAIAAHLGQVHDICPYARQAARDGTIQYAALKKGMAPTPERARKFLRQGMAQFLNGDKKVLIIVLEDNFPTIGDAHRSAKAIFREVGIVAGARAFPRESENQMVKMYDQTYPQLLDPSFRVKRPLVPFRNGNNRKPDDLLFVFMMHPSYPKTHPRYAPFPIVVVNYNEDLERAISEHPEVSARITINGTVGIAQPHIPGVSIEELRRGSHAEIVYGLDGIREGFATTYHSAITPELQLLIAAIYKKTLFEFPLAA